MKMRQHSFATSATIALACSAALAPLILPASVAAQPNPTMTNVIPDGGNFATQGKIQALDPGASTLTIVPESSPPIPMTVAPGVNLTDISVGDVASVHYTRSVTFVVGSPNVAAPQATTTVGQVAQTPGGIGAGASTIAGRVVKLNGPTSFDVVNANGGGIYP
jgi:hypothetical protein